MRIQQRIPEGGFGWRPDRGGYRCLAIQQRSGPGTIEFKQIWQWNGSTTRWRPDIFYDPPAEANRRRKERANLCDNLYDPRPIR